MKLQKRRFLIPVMLIGPLLALFVTWQPAIDITRVDVPTTLSDQVVQGLRATPPDGMLKELADTGVSYPRYDDMPDAEVLSIADALLSNNYEVDEGYEPIGVPFEPGTYLFGQSGWHLDFHSFAVPSLLARAFEVSGDVEYLRAAVRFVLDWSRFEASLWLPLGFTFNDHATAARAIVLTEIWHQYRSSEIVDEKTTGGYLDYVRRQIQLLMDERLYEYRTNHGIMQCLSLMHLAIAFPELPEATEAFNLGADRLLAQLEYYLSPEGMILEHSGSYHVNGLARLAAGWRYFGMRGVPISPEMRERYQKSLDFGAALRRPDGTVALFGDTGTDPYTLYPIVEFNRNGVAEQPLRRPNDQDLFPRRTTVDAAAGYVILWDGLHNWPRTDDLAQTAFHWGNFPTGAHKHADELGISLWAGGSQWIRGIGSWPYDASRLSALGWRSSNGPHWLSETADTPRDSSLLGSAVADGVAVFDVIRRNDDGGSLRRQLLHPDPRTWIVLDSFVSDRPRVAETVWRFSPELSLEVLGGERFAVTSEHERLTIAITGHEAVEADPDGSAPWNGGISVHGEIVPAPALRVLSGPEHAAIAGVFQLSGSQDSAQTAGADLTWSRPDAWTLAAEGAGGLAVGVRRDGNALSITRGGRQSPQVTLSNELAAQARSANSQAVNAYFSAVEKYGKPFSAMLMRRSKVSIAVLAAAAAQIVLFVAVRRRYARWLRPAVAVSSLAWVALSVYIGMFFLV